MGKVQERMKNYEEELDYVSSLIRYQGWENSDKLPNQNVLLKLDLAGQRQN